MRLAFLGSPAMAVPFLQALVEAGHHIALVVSQPDKRRGRGAETMPSPVKAAALALGLPVTDRVADVKDAGVELGVVVAFGRLIKPDVLERVLMVNVHFSLLPRWRGAAPLERAILAGDTETGVCLMQLEEGLDTGPVYACETLPIEPGETAESLRGRLVDAGVALMLRMLEGGLPEPVPQEGDATYAAKLEHDDHRLDWGRPAEELHRIVRLGRAWTTFRGRRLLVVRASQAATGPEPGVVDGLVVGTGDGRGLVLEVVQPEGKGPQRAGDWRNGARLQPGERLE
jgi:methionyl-tRNA formyltransferase